MWRTLTAIVTVLLSGLQSPARAQETPSPELRVATYNVCKTTCGKGRFAWRHRRHAVVRNVASARPDVIALQEVNHSYPWLADRLAEHGYRRVVPQHDGCVKGCAPDSQLFYRAASVEQAELVLPSPPVPDVCEPFLEADGDLFSRPVRPELPPKPLSPVMTREEPGYQEAVSGYASAYQLWRQTVAAQRDAHHAALRNYRDLRSKWTSDTANRCTPFDDWRPEQRWDAGSVALGTLADIDDAIDNRNVDWAILRHRHSGSLFVAAGLHLPNEKSARAESARRHLGVRLDTFLNRRLTLAGIPEAPIMLLGDLNSFTARQPHGVQAVLRKRGYDDAFTAEDRVNARVSTINVTRTRRDPFPHAPFRSDHPARLDYVMVKRAQATRYEVHVVLRHGCFDDRFRGSDHNLVSATVRIPRMPAV